MLYLSRNLHVKVHQVLRLPRNLHVEVRQVLRLPRKICTSRFTKCCACHETCTSRFTKCRACPEIRTSRFTKCCTCHEICTSRVTECCAFHEIFKTRHLSKSHCSPHLSRNLSSSTTTMSKVLHLPRKLHFVDRQLQSLATVTKADFGAPKHDTIYTKMRTAPQRERSR